ALILGRVNRTIHYVEETTAMVSYPEFKGRTAIVTGGASQGSIGENIAIDLGAQGARVAVVDIDEAGAERTAQGIRDAGGDAFPVRCDVTSQSSVRDMVKAVVDRT